MKKLSLLLILIGFPVMLAAQNTLTELDSFWDETSRTVSEGDFEGYSALYHEDAVLVNEISSESYPISKALAGWKKGFDDTKEGIIEAGVEFRFSERLHGGGTAFERGIFRYYSINKEGEKQVFLAHMEALLVKKDGRWLMIMENQKAMATEEEWKALK